jgi:GNAT superfamily N-acetyltransferase
MEIAEALPYLQCHTEHSYWVLIRYGHRYVLVAEDETGDRVGYLSSVRSTVDPRVFFLWQLGVRPREQGGGLGMQLMEAFFTKAEADGGPETVVNAAIDNDNAAALHLLDRWCEYGGWTWSRLERLFYTAREGGVENEVTEDLVEVRRSR